MLATCSTSVLTPSCGFGISHSFISRQAPLNIVVNSVKSYTLFFVLYPSGAGSEMVQIYTALGHVVQDELFYVFVILIGLYIPRMFKETLHACINTRLASVFPSQYF